MRQNMFPMITINLLLLVFYGCESMTKIDGTSSQINSFAKLKENFQAPPAAYQTAPFWVWNDRITSEEIDRQLADFKAKGIGGVFIHPRYGLITEYLSDDWFELVQYSVEKAKELGMHAWLYDENSFPSGFAGGHVPAEMPESYNQGQGLILHKFDHLPDDAENYFLILKRTDAQFEEITSPNELKDKRGDFYSFELTHYGKSKWYGGFSYVDLLVEGVTEKFIEVTMRGYERTIGDEFGKFVPGIFTDEPNIRPPGRNSMRWTPGLFEKFGGRWGYELKTNLPSIFEEVGDWKRVRHNYYALLLELFIERWSKPWYHYCEKHNLKWTGHYWEHGWPNPEHGSDNMAMYAWHQMPGIDMLFNNMDERPDQFGNIRAVKELSSVANQLRRKRTLSETYGAAGWELRFEDMKRLGDWEYVLGVNFMNQHLSFMSLAGDRKHDFPQSFSYHAPWWEFYKPLADYFARLSLALSSGQQVNHILILEPTTTTWMYYSPNESHEQLWKIRETFHAFLEEFEKYQIEYDLGCENIINDHGEVDAGKFVIAERAYEVLVFPPGMENLDLPTVRLLEKYLEAGGKILSFVAEPEFINGEKTNKLQSLLSRYEAQWIRAESIHDENAKDLLSPNYFQVLQPEEIGGKLFHQRRQFEDGELVFLANSSLEEGAKGSLVINGKSVIELNAFTGDITFYPFEIKDEKATVSFDLPPAGSLLLFVSATAQKTETKKTSYEKEKTISASSDLKIERIEPNTLTLDYCDLKLGDTEDKGIYFYTASDKIFKHHGFDDNPWVSSAQYRTNIVDRDTFSVNSGFEVAFHFEIAEGVDRSSLRAVVERPNLWRVSINGEIIRPLKDEWWLDRSFGVFDISNHAKSGLNSISLLTSPMSIHAELEPLYILGNFGLVSQVHGWKMVQSSSLLPGEWRKQGLPFYPDGVAYTKTYQLSSDEKHYAVKLGEWLGSVAVVRINGKQAGIIGWQPYELDISKFIIDGENEIKVIVYGSLKNLLGPHHNVKRRGIVTPWSFKYAPESQPPGADYDLDGYGLFEDFGVIERE